MELAPRPNRPNSNATVVLDVTELHILKNSIIPIFNSIGETVLFKTKKLTDFSRSALEIL